MIQQQTFDTRTRHFWTSFRPKKHVIPKDNKLHRGASLLKKYLHLCEHNEDVQAFFSDLNDGFWPSFRSNKKKKVTCIIEKRRQKYIPPYITFYCFIQFYYIFFRSIPPCFNLTTQNWKTFLSNLYFFFLFSIILGRLKFFFLFRGRIFLKVARDRPPKLVPFFCAGFFPRP